MNCAIPKGVKNCPRADRLDWSSLAVVSLRTMSTWLNIRLNKFNETRTGYEGTAITFIFENILFVFFISYVHTFSFDPFFSNLPRDHDKICNILPRNCDNNYILYRSIHIFFALPYAFFRLRQSCKGISFVHPLN